MSDTMLINGVEFDLKKVVNHGEVNYEVYKDGKYLFSDDNKTIIRRELSDNFNDYVGESTTEFST
jgi:hypothetical protein